MHVAKFFDNILANKFFPKMRESRLIEAGAWLGREAVAGAEIQSWVVSQFVAMSEPGTGRCQSLAETGGPGLDVLESPKQRFSPDRVKLRRRPEIDLL